MFTRCPRCKAVHVLTAAVASQARGEVRCGPCGSAFNAWDFLFDEWPGGRAYEPLPETAGKLPVLGRLGAGGVAAGRATGETAAEQVPAGRRAWALATVLLTLLTAVNAAWTWREPIREHAVTAGWLQPDEPQGLPKDPGRFLLVSRDLHTHPTRSGLLVLSLSFVNLAEGSQAYPDLELTLLDSMNQPVARRRLEPGDYLRPGTDTGTGLAADVYLPVLLELGDPGDRAVGFEIRFL